MNNASSCALALAAALSIPLSAAPASATCWDEAASRYGLPADLLRAVAHVESHFDANALRKPYAAGNVDGSYDTGLMQINSSWHTTLERYGIDEADLYDACTNLQVGAWILAHNIARLGWNWDAIGAYNAGCKKLSRARCAALRNRYAWRVWRAWHARPASITPATATTTASTAP